jgi:hypothetical protein
MIGSLELGSSIARQGPQAKQSKQQKKNPLGHWHFTYIQFSTYYIKMWRLTKLIKLQPWALITSLNICRLVGIRHRWIGRTILVSVDIVCGVSHVLYYSVISTPPFIVEERGASSNSLTITELQVATVQLQCSSATTALDLKMLLVQISHEKWRVDAHSDAVLSTNAVRS